MFEKEWIRRQIPRVSLPAKGGARMRMPRECQDLVVRVLTSRIVERLECTSWSMLSSRLLGISFSAFRKHRDALAECVLGVSHVRYFGWWSGEVYCRIVGILDLRQHNDERANDEVRCVLVRLQYTSQTYNRNLNHPLTHYYHHSMTLLSAIEGGPQRRAI